MVLLLLFLQIFLINIYIGKTKLNEKTKQNKTTHKTKKKKRYIQIII